MDRLLGQFWDHVDQPVMGLAPKKVFMGEHREIPRLLHYTGEAPASWWLHWPHLTWEEGKCIKSSINSVKMVRWASRAAHPDMGMVLEIARDIRVGCDLGTRGEYLCPSTSSNAPSAFEYGERVTDSIVDGIKKGIMMGPMNEDEIPFESVKVNGMMVKLKENGVARICMNMSRGDPFPANEGMFNDERFEVRMSSTKDWLVSLHSAGRGCYFCKTDWSGAYKQLRTQHADVRQQFFKWGGKWFAELCLTFGGASSVGLFDRLAKVFMFIVTVLSETLPKHVRQIIDDVVACGTERQVRRFHKKYREVAEDCGVMLAPEDDPKKAFSAAQVGEVFGVMYDTVNFTWWLREDKQALIVHMLIKLGEENRHKLGYVKSVVGKLIAYRTMVPNGKFYLGQLIRISRSGPGDSMDREVRMTDWGRSEAWFWRNMMPFCGRRTVLPDPCYRLPPSTARGHTDAAGGSTVHVGYGVGAVLGEQWWTYIPWGEAINKGRMYVDGTRLDCKMSAWELLGPLLLLCAGRDHVENRSLVVPVDNQGSVSIYGKGWCTSCMLCTTLALAISEVAASLNCELEIVKIRRCSNEAAEAADAISKAEWTRFRRLMPRATAGPAWVPRALLYWVENPVEDRHLGGRIVRELGIRENVLGHHREYLGV